MTNLTVPQRVLFPETESRSVPTAAPCCSRATERVYDVPVERHRG